MRLTVGVSVPLKLPWIFPGAPLTFNRAPENIQGNLIGMSQMIVVVKYGL